MKSRFRYIGSIGLLVALFCRFNPIMILPASFGHPGVSGVVNWGIWLSAFTDILNIAISGCLLLIILSFTNIVEKTNCAEESIETDSGNDNKDWENFINKK